MILNNFRKWRAAIEYGQAVSSMNTAWASDMIDEHGNTGVNIGWDVTTGGNGANERFCKNLDYRISESGDDVDADDYAVPNTSYGEEFLENRRINCVTSYVDGELIHTITVSGRNPIKSDSELSEKRPMVARKVVIVKKIYNASSTYKSVQMAVIDLNSALTVNNGESFTITVKVVER